MELNIASRPRSARTKIVATVGPACREPARLTEMIRKGVDVFRLNMAHGQCDQQEQVIHDIRRASDEAGRLVGILVDLAGPKIRLGQLFQDPTECHAGDEFCFARGSTARAERELVSNYEALIDELSVGDQVMLADGTVSMSVTQKSADQVRCRVTGGGLVRSRQGINLPGVDLSVPAMTEKDLADAEWAARMDVDLISLSFVRSADEVYRLKQLVQHHGSAALTIAKIEKGEALKQLEQIVLAADGIMVARGDLGVEIDLAETPAAQKRIITTCQQQARPVIVATQMLDSMQHSRRPTRAEVSDVANAILDGADACMLSGETAIGDFPVETVEMMGRIMEATERLLLHRADASPPVPALTGVHPITSATVNGAVEIARQLHAALMVIATHGGATARVKSKLRDGIPVVAVSDSPQTLRQLSLYWGVTPLPGAPVTNGPELRRFIDQWGRTAGLLTTGDRVVYVTVSDFVSNAHNGVVVQEVE